jgi:hypothetical protein
VTTLHLCACAIPEEKPFGERERESRTVFLVKRFYTDKTHVSCGRPLATGVEDNAKRMATMPAVGIIAILLALSSQREIELL